MIYVNDPKLMHFSYLRYLENQIRAEYGFLRNTHSDCDEGQEGIALPRLAISIQRSVFADGFKFLEQFNITLPLKSQFISAPEASL